MAPPTQDVEAQRAICPLTVVDGTAVIESTWSSSEAFLLPDLRATPAPLTSPSSSVCAETGAPDLRQLASRSAADDDAPHLTRVVGRAETEHEGRPHLSASASASSSSPSVQILRETEAAIFAVVSSLTTSDVSSPRRPPSPCDFGRGLMPEPSPRPRRRPSVPAPTPRRYARPVDSLLLQHARGAHHEARQRPSPIPAQVTLRLPHLRHAMAPTPTPPNTTPSPQHTSSLTLPTPDLDDFRENDDPQSPRCRTRPREGKGHANTAPRGTPSPTNILQSGRD